MSFHYLINFWFLTKKQVHSLFSETFCCRVTYSFIISHKNDKNIKAFIVLGNVMLVTVIVMVATGILIVSVVIFQVFFILFAIFSVNEYWPNEDFDILGFILRWKIVSFPRAFKMRRQIIENERKQCKSEITMVNSQEKFFIDHNFLLKTLDFSHCEQCIDLDACVKHGIDVGDGFRRCLC